MADAILESTLSTAERIETLKAAALAHRQIGVSHHLVVPQDYVHIDITKYVEEAEVNPNRKRGTVHLQDLASLIDYCKAMSCKDVGFIYADPDSREIVAVLNDHRGRLAGWRDHRASYKAAFTPEFERWLSNSGSAKAKDQTTFAEFIEDNIADISEPAGAQLLEVATTIQAKTDISFSSARRLDNGQVQLGYTETIDAKAGANGALSIPREFSLGLRIFKNGDGYKLSARLKYRLIGGTVKFWYELDRPERAIEDAFSGYIARLREQSGYQVLIGKP